MTTTPQQPDKEPDYSDAQYRRNVEECSGRGVQIQSKCTRINCHCGQSEWEDDNTRCFDWTVYIYRIKPTPSVKESLSPQPVSENKGDDPFEQFVKWFYKNDGMYFEQHVSELRRLFVTRQEHERVKGLVEKAFKEGYSNSAFGIGHAREREWNRSAVKKELEG